MRPMSQAPPLDGQHLAQPSSLRKNSPTPSRRRSLRLSMQDERQETDDGQRISTYRGRRQVRRIADRDAAGPPGSPGPARRPRDLPQRHPLDARGAGAGRRRAARAGACSTRCVATGCPAIETYTFDFGPVTIAGHAAARDGLLTGYAPRRTVLDKILVDAAAGAGAEVREGFTVDERRSSRTASSSGSAATMRTAAQSPSGRRSWSAPTAATRRVARTVGAEHYNEKPHAPVRATTRTGATCRWTASRSYIRPDRGFARAARPTTV